MCEAHPACVGTSLPHSLSLLLSLPFSLSLGTICVMFFRGIIGTHVDTVAYLLSDIVNQVFISYICVIIYGWYLPFSFIFLCLYVKIYFVFCIFFVHFSAILWFSGGKLPAGGSGVIAIRSVVMVFVLKPPNPCLECGEATWLV